MLFTIIRARVARLSSPLEGIREIKDTNTVVLPAPVGNDTPIRRTPLPRASKQA